MIGDKTKLISNNFELVKLEKLGEGGSGTVYKVHDIKTKRLYALKVLRKNPRETG